MIVVLVVVEHVAVTTAVVVCVVFPLRGGVCGRLIVVVIVVLVECGQRFFVGFDGVFTPLLEGGVVAPRFVQGECKQAVSLGLWVSRVGEIHVVPVRHAFAEQQGHNRGLSGGDVMSCGQRVFCFEALPWHDGSAGGLLPVKLHGEAVETQVFVVVVTVLVISEFRRASFESAGCCGRIKVVGCWRDKRFVGDGWCVWLRETVAPRRSGSGSGSRVFGTRDVMVGGNRCACDVFEQGPEVDVDEIVTVVVDAFVGTKEPQSCDGRWYFHGAAESIEEGESHAGAFRNRRFVGLFVTFNGVLKSGHHPGRCVARIRHFGCVGSGVENLPRVCANDACVGVASVHSEVQTVVIRNEFAAMSPFDDYLD